MAHDLNIENEKVSFFSVKEKAWHGLGTVLDKAPTSAEAIKYAGLDFEVVKVPNLIEWPIGSGNFKETPRSFSTVRQDNGEILGDKIGKVYSIVQNKDAFSFFDAIVGAGEAIYETAGALGKGETIFITAKLPSYIRVGNKDDIEKYLLLSMSHDGSGSIQAMFTPVRVVCNNTLNAALSGNGHKISIRHTKSAIGNLAEAHIALGIANKLSDNLNDAFNRMTKVKMKDEDVKQYIQNVFLPDEILKTKVLDNLTKYQQETIDDCFEYYHNGPGQQMDTCKGTMFGAYNSVTGYFANVKSFKDETSKMKSNLLGTNYNTMQKAFDLSCRIS